MAHEAGVQDRDGAPALLASMRTPFLWPRFILTDSAYAGPKLCGVLDNLGERTIEIITRSDAAKDFEILLYRWVVERTFAWLGRCCRRAKDFEGTIESAVAWITIASICLLTRRLARH